MSGTLNRISSPVTFYKWPQSVLPWKMLSIARQFGAYICPIVSVFFPLAASTILGLPLISDANINITCVDSKNNID